MKYKKIRIGIRIWMGEGGWMGSWRRKNARKEGEGEVFTHSLASDIRFRKGGVMTTRRGGVGKEERNKRRDFIYLYQHGRLRCIDIVLYEPTS
jgi:hypothetical protein